MRNATLRCACLAAVLAVASVPAVAAPDGRYGKIELLRDTWGIAHVFSDTDEGAFYGLGYATAEERGFQMHYSLRIIQGRLAELLGEARMAGRRESALDNDRKMRTFGFHRAAQKAAAGLDAPTLGLLRAYCEGVNDAFAAHRGRPHPLLAKLALEAEPWTPADCIASWWHLGQFFATDGTRELIHWRTVAAGGGGRGAGRGGLVPPAPTPLWLDDDAAVVRREDVSDEWVARTEDFCRRHGLGAAGGPASQPEGPKFSHAWVVGGRRTTTGAAVLVSDPQTPVRNPPLWQEFHIRGATFNARGVGVPGSPGILIGFNEHLAWGATALGADQADLFRLRTDPSRPDEYFFDGQWRKMAVRRETLRVRGAKPVELAVRETHFGPVVTAFAFPVGGDPEVALKRVPVCQTEAESIQGLIAMLRARDIRQLASAAAGWHFPSANLVFGDGEGGIGYWAAGATPIRSRLDAHEGRAALDGSDSRYDWQGYVPHDLKPHVLNPSRGWIASGNHRPIASFYRIPIGISTGSGGHTTRSWRLYELLEGKDRWRPEDVLAVHYDSVNPARREIVRAGLFLRDVAKAELSGDAVRALERLEPWYRGGARSDLAVAGAETAGAVSTFFRFIATPLAGKYGGGETGLTRFLRDLGPRMAKDERARLSQEERQFIDDALAAAWRAMRQQHGVDPAGWGEAARRSVTRQRLGWFDSLDGFGSLDPAGDLACPALTCVDGGTIRSQAGQSYTQYVPLHDPDAAQTILPPGHSDLPDGPARTSTMALWEAGSLHSAPLSRKAVEAIAAQRKMLSK